MQRGSDHYAVLAVVGYANSRDPRRLWKLAARPVADKTNWDSVFAELEPCGDLPPSILVADGAQGAWSAASDRCPDIRGYRCSWHREERARNKPRLAGYVGTSTLLGRLLPVVLRPGACRPTCSATRSLT